MAAQPPPLHNRYRLVERLGAGGMSLVWRGHDQVLGRPVAVKVLAARLADDQAFRYRIRAEAQAAARLNHPHIANVYDYGEAPTPGGPVPYVVMELVDGEPLSARLAGGVALPWRDAVRACAEVAAALATAHARGIVHRDVTPGNVMLTHAGAKVVDFGISALVGERNDDGPDGTLLGTPAYLAPERLEDGQVIPATDVYALGLLLYRCLTGRLPWQASTTTGMLQAHLYTEPAPMPPVAGLPAEVAELCHRCLAKDPADRPSSVDVARTLAGVVGAVAVLPAASSGASLAASPGAPPGAPPASGLETTFLPWSTEPLPTAVAPTTGRRPGRRMQAAAVAGALLGLAATGWAAGAFDPDPVAAEQPSSVAAGIGPAAKPCQVRYAVTGRDGAQIRLTVTNAGTRPVTLAAPARTLAPGRSVTVRTVDGGALPMAHDADGVPCTALVDGSVGGVTGASAGLGSGARSGSGSGSGYGKDKPTKDKGHHGHGDGHGDGDGDGNNQND